MIATLSVNLSVTGIRFILRKWVSDSGNGTRIMDSFSKFGFCLICMLALVLLAVTPNSATSNGIAGSQNEPMKTSGVKDFPAGRATV